MEEVWKFSGTAHFQILMTYIIIKLLLMTYKKSITLHVPSLLFPDLLKQGLKGSWSDQKSGQIISVISTHQL